MDETAPIQRTFGDRIRTQRMRLRLSQEQLAERCGLHRTYIGGVERGERNIALVNIVRLASALNIDPSELVKGIRAP